MKTLLVIFLVVLTALAGTAVAQEDFTNLRPCTARQLMETITWSDQEFSEGYTAITAIIRNLSTGENTMLDLALAADDLQVRWWYEIAPEFPRCAEAVALEMTVGRVLDELVITGLQAHIAVMSDEMDEDMFRRARDHMETWDLLQGEFQALLEVWGE